MSEEPFLESSKTLIVEITIMFPKLRNLLNNRLTIEVNNLDMSKRFLSFFKFDLIFKYIPDYIISYSAVDLMSKVQNMQSQIDNLTEIVKKNNINC